MSKECPFCGNLINDSAIKCRYCQEWLNQYCPVCKNQVSSKDKRCKYCNSKINPTGIKAVLLLILSIFLTLFHFCICVGVSDSYSGKEALEIVMGSMALVLLPIIFVFKKSRFAGYILITINGIFTSLGFLMISASLFE